MQKASTLYLTCGLPGSGKTSLATQIERTAPAVRLTGDEWLQELFPDMTTLEAETGPFRSRIERLQWHIAMRILALGTDVVVDWGVWSKNERDIFRSAAQGAGARVVLCLLDPPLDILWERVARRNSERPFGAFMMTKDDLLRWSGMFERPTADELSLYDDLRLDPI